MKIQKVTTNKKQYLDLLLLADEQENMIDRYLEQGTMYVLNDNGIIAVCVVTDEDNKALEIKNIAVKPEFQRMGYGKAMLDFITKKYKDIYDIIQVGTGEVPVVVTFYEKCGFIKSHKIKNFFTDNYDHPIFEDGIQLVDMIYLKFNNQMMKNQLMRDFDIEPTIENISECLGFANTAYTKFINELKSHNIVVNWRYYKDGKAWLGKGLYKWTTTRGTKKETTAFWLSVWNGFFKVTIYIPEKYRTEALKLSLSDEMKEMIKASKQMGKLKFFPITFNLRSDEMFNELFTIINFRKILK